MDCCLHPNPRGFCPLPTAAEVVVNTQIQWGLPPSLQQLEVQTVGLHILSMAEVGTTVLADHLLQMATMPLEHKPTALGILCALPVSHQFEGAEELLHSLHALFGPGNGQYPAVLSPGQWFRQASLCRSWHRQCSYPVHCPVHGFSSAIWRIHFGQSRGLWG